MLVVGGWWIRNEALIVCWMRTTPHSPLATFELMALAVDTESCQTESMYAADRNHGAVEARTTWDTD